jgi:hypothetical protein
MATQQCSPGAITSFPLQIAITATDTLYDTVSEPITMDIQWATRSTPPMFRDPKTTAITDEVGAGNTNLTTLRFMNNNYTVNSVQLIGASHNAWIVPSTSQSMNVEDIVITFAATDTTVQNSYITFVIPILRTSTVTNPSYLTGLSDSNASGPFSLQSCFPANTRARFAYYSTCLSGYSGKSSTRNMYVFVSTDGIQVSTTLMTKILSLTGRTSGFGTYSSSFITRLTSNKTIIKNIGDFTNYVMSTTQLLNFNDFKRLYPTIDTNLRQDDTSAYQCVAIDPDSAIVDGKLSVDIKTGEVLTNVLAQRDAVRASNNVAGSMDPGRLERYMSTALGVILSILLFWAIIYFTIVSYKTVMSSPGLPPPDTPAWMTSIPNYGVMFLITGFIGFVIGTMIN